MSVLFARYTGKALSPLTGLMHYLSVYGGLFIMRHTWEYRALQLCYYIIISHTQRHTSLVPLFKKACFCMALCIQYAAKMCCALLTYCLDSVLFRVASASREGNSQGRQGESLSKRGVCVCACVLCDHREAAPR